MTQRTVSSWWWLLLLLVCLPAGWLIGQSSGGKASAPTGGTPAWAASAPGKPAARGPELSAWTTLDHAIEESKRNGKPVMLDFNAEWCGPCQMMKQMVFDARDPGTAVRTAVIPVSVVDRRREDGRNPDETDRLQRQHQIEAFPTLVVFSPKTGRTQKLRGFRGGEFTLSWIQQAAQDVR